MAAAEAHAAQRRVDVLAEAARAAGCVSRSAAAAVSDAGAGEASAAETWTRLRQTMSDVARASLIRPAATSAAKAESAPVEQGGGAGGEAPKDAYSDPSRFEISGRVVMSSKGAPAAAAAATAVMVVAMPRLQPPPNFSKFLARNVSRITFLFA